MDAIDKLGALIKGEARGGKYFRRVATGNPKKPWKYYYTKEQYQKEHGDKAHLHGGDSQKEHNPSGDMATYLGHAKEAKSHHEDLAKFHGIEYDNPEYNRYKAADHQKSAATMSRVELNSNYTRAVHKEHAQRARNMAGYYEDNGDPHKLAHPWRKIAEAHEGMAKYYPNEKEHRASVGGSDEFYQQMEAEVAADNDDTEKSMSMKTLSRDVVEAERAEAMEQMGTLAKSEVVVLADDVQPQDQLGQMRAQRMQCFQKSYTDGGGLSLHDDACPFHGRDPYSQSREQDQVSGAACTC